MDISIRFEPEVYRMLAVALKEPRTATPSFDEMVSGLVNHFKKLWWSCEPSLPDLGRVYSLQEKKAREASLGNSLDRLGQELHRISISHELPDRPALQERLQQPVAGGVRYLACVRPDKFGAIERDLGIDGVSCYGADKHQTPHIDALASSGLRFQTCYA